VPLRLPVQLEFCMFVCMKTYEAMTGRNRCKQMKRKANSASKCWGNSMVVRPSGLVAAMTEGNQQEAAVGEVSIGGKPSLYNRFGDWFAIAVSLAAGLFAVYALRAGRRGE